MIVNMIEFKKIEVKEGIKNIVIPLFNENHTTDYNLSYTNYQDISSKRIHIEKFRTISDDGNIEEVYIGATIKEFEMLGVGTNYLSSPYVVGLERELEETKNSFNIKNEMYLNLANRNYELLEKVNEFEKMTFLGWIKYFFTKEVI